MKSVTQHTYIDLFMNLYSTCILYVDCTIDYMINDKQRECVRVSETSTSLRSTAVLSLSHLCFFLYP